MFDYHQNLDNPLLSMEEPAPNALSQTTRLINSMSLSSDDDEAEVPIHSKHSALLVPSNQSSHSVTEKEEFESEQGIKGEMPGDL